MTKSVKGRIESALSEISQSFLVYFRDFSKVPGGTYFAAAYLGKKNSGNSVISTLGKHKQNVWEILKKI